MEYEKLRRRSRVFFGSKLFFNPIIMMIRFSLPTATHRLFDPMPLPRRMTMPRRARLMMQHYALNATAFKRTVKRVS